MRLYYPLIFLIFILISCKFNRPLTSVRISKIVLKDTLNNGEIIKIHYNFIRISRYGITGDYYVEKKYDSKGFLTNKSTTKISAKVRDGFVKSKRKNIQYINNKKTEIKLSISKSQGWGKGKNILNKTFIFDENGRKRTSLLLD